jgi:nucleotidyltransferase substrate binding protein (TIGR01987 family)
MDSLARRLQLARKALSSLRAVLRLPGDEVVRDSAIKRFEYTFETVWKAGQAYVLQNENVDAASPKAVFRAAGPAGLFTEEQVSQAVGLANDRNLTVHMYKESLAAEIYARLPAHADLLEHLLEGMERSAGIGRLPLKENT